MIQSQYDFFYVIDSNCLVLTQPKITHQNAHKFKQELITYLASHDGNVSLDFSNVSNLGCAGLAVLIQGIALKQKRKEPLTLHNLNDTITYEIMIAGLKGLLAYE